VQEFQEQAILRSRSSKRILAQRAWAEPTLEALSAQLLVIVFALATYSVIQRNNRLSRADKPRFALRGLPLEL